ncbi:MAG: DUF1549 domain-containing protein [Verrucomicrobiales bacterium]|nr:DUF1549 domain-containing protein [Verrucomicrobiales bacterium]
MPLSLHFLPTDATAWKPMVFGFLGLFCLPSALPAEEHWSLRPLHSSTVNDGENGVDPLIHRGLAKQKLRQNDEADRYTLIRRATLDLTGVPPTREEITAFVEDKSSDAWEKLIERLLASPHYGERWGRHWLDVARYVQGTIKVPGINKTDLAEPYRDYVVRSFNQDKPYNQFLTEQLAGDLLPTTTRGKEAAFDQLIAPAFLSIGQWFDECTDPNKLRLDLVDEQISTVTRAFLAMDFACARCHDHKFDPIPTRDYYALAGIFRSTEITEYFSEEWKDGRPRALRPLASATELANAAKIGSAREALIQERFSILSEVRNRLTTNLPQTKSLPTASLRFEAEKFDGQKDLKTIALGDRQAIATRRRLDQWVRYRITPVGNGPHTLLIRYAAPEAAPVLLEINGKTEKDRILTEPTFGETEEHFHWTAVPLPPLKPGTNFLRLKVNRNEAFPTLDQFILVPGAFAKNDNNWRSAAGPLSVAEMSVFLTEEERSQVTDLETQIKDLAENRPDFPLTLAVNDARPLLKLPIHPGGDADTTSGDPVPRGVPSFADHLMKRSFPVPDDESGRVQLAEWLTDPQNPLPARVLANRIWHWHFGTGLVRTTDDFGIQGSPPMHPELLDWLAGELIQNGWSIKHLHRLIMNSDTYRASSLKTPDNSTGDPDGLLFSRFPSHRLEIEAIYDSMLTSIGKVPRQASGATLDTSKSKDRALYILTSSRSPLGMGIEIRKMFPLFGFDDSGRPMHRRDDSTTPAQSLWWLNNPLPHYYAGKLAEQLISRYPEIKERTRVLHETVLGRPPESAAEEAITSYARDSIESNHLSEVEAWTRICLGLYSSRTFRQLE